MLNSLRLFWGFEKRIFFFSFFLRLCWVIFVPNTQCNDGAAFKSIAQQLASSGEFYYSYFRAFITPGYPFFLSCFYWFGDVPDIIIKIAQTIPSSFSVVLLYKITASYLPQNTARISSWGYALYLNQIGFCSIFFSEVVFTFLLLWYVWLLLKPGSPYLWVFQGLVLAAITYVKPQAFLLCIIISFFFLIRKKMSLNIVLMHSLLAFVLVCFWIGRNYLLIHHAVMATNGQYNLYIGNNDKAGGGYSSVGLKDDLTEDELLTYYSAELIKHGMPLSKYPRLLAHKFYYQYLTDADAIRYWIIHGIEDPGIKNNVYTLRHICNLQYLFIVLGCAIALLKIVFRRLKISLLFFIPFLFFTLLQLVFFGNPRYHFPAMPFLLPVAISGWLSLVKRGKEETSSN